MLAFQQNIRNIAGSINAEESAVITDLREEALNTWTNKVPNVIVSDRMFNFIDHDSKSKCGVMISDNRLTYQGVPGIWRPCGLDFDNISGNGLCRIHRDMTDVLTVDQFREATGIDPITNLGNVKLSQDALDGSLLSQSQYKLGTFLSGYRSLARLKKRLLSALEIASKIKQELSDEKENCEQRLREAEARIQELNQENERLQDDCEQKLGQAEAEYNTLNAEFNQERKRYGECERKVEELRREIIESSQILVSATSSMSSFGSSGADVERVIRLAGIEEDNKAIANVLEWAKTENILPDTSSINTTKDARNFINTQIDLKNLNDAAGGVINPEYLQAMAWAAANQIYTRVNTQTQEAAREAAQRQYDLKRVVDLAGATNDEGAIEAVRWAAPQIDGKKLQNVDGVENARNVIYDFEKRLRTDEVLEKLSNVERKKVDRVYDMVNFNSSDILETLAWAAAQNLLKDQDVDSIQTEEDAQRLVRKFMNERKNTLVPIESNIF